MSLRWRSIRQLGARTKLTIALAFATALVLVVYSSVVYAMVSDIVARRIREVMTRDLDFLTKVVKDSPEQLNYYLNHPVVQYFKVTLSNGQVYMSDGWEELQIDDAVHEPIDRISWVNADRSAYCVLTASVPAAGDMTATITVAKDLEPYTRSKRGLQAVTKTALPLFILASIIAGYFFAGRLLAPVGHMASKARIITAENLAERLPVYNPHDEFGQLAIVINETLGRLENSFDELRRFTSDASHQLRTPLTVIRAVGELGLQKAYGDPEATADAISSMLEEADKLSRLVDSLLLLARGDSAQIRLHLEPVDLSALAREVADVLSVLAEERGQSVWIRVNEPVVSMADRTTLRQAMINLLDNAVKHGKEGGNIDLTIGCDGTNAYIDVSDDGAGIPPEMTERVFERFARLHTEGDGPAGSGLGLSIARWAARINGGDVLVVPRGTNRAGATFRLRLPQPAPKN